MSRIAAPVLAALLLAVAAFPLASARADDKLQTSNAEWKAMDNCTHEAFHKFPDYTHESNTKREAYRRMCLRKRGLPAPDTVATPPQ
jgi:hypothetical protein